jgi:hypothetical protein
MPAPEAFHSEEPEATPDLTPTPLSKDIREAVMDSVDGSLQRFVHEIISPYLNDVPEPIIKTDYLLAQAPVAQATNEQLRPHSRAASLPVSLVASETAPTSEGRASRYKKRSAWRLWG